MSERLNSNESGAEHAATPESNEHLPKRHEHHTEANEKKINTTEVRKAIEHIEDSSSEDEITKKLQAPAAEKVDLPPPNDDVKAAALNHYLVEIRHHLSGPAKNFSKFIHNPKVNTANEITAKTIARPYGILLGAIFTCIGSGLYLYLLHHSGYKYNYFVPLALFASGYIIGFIIEMVTKRNTGHKRS